jgi:hypothetical protein
MARWIFIMLSPWRGPETHTLCDADRRDAVGVVAIVIAALGLTTDVKLYGLLTGWLALGLVYYSFTRRRRARTQPAAEV